MTALRALAITALFAASCGHSAESIVLRSAATLAVATTSGYRGLRSYDAEKQAGIQKRARGGDPDGAEVERLEYIPKRDAALKVLGAASVGAEGALAAVSVVGQALDKKRRADLSAWIPVLAKLGIDVVQALGVLGIRVPGLGGAP